MIRYNLIKVASTDQGSHRHIVGLSHYMEMYDTGDSLHTEGSTWGRWLEKKHGISVITRKQFYRYTEIAR